MLDLAKIIIKPSPLQQIYDELFERKNIKFYLKRDDLLHPLVSGNKWRKMKYNLLKMNELGAETLLTFGGAFSNHIYSTAAAGKIFGFKTIGIIRGEELNENSNATLKFATECGMKLIFVSRETYKNKDVFLQSFTPPSGVGELYILPEGGTNELALKGVGEMVNEVIDELTYIPDTIATAVGSGGTLAGISSVFYPSLMPLGIAVTSEKQATITFEDIHNLLTVNGLCDFQFNKNSDFNFGGYARTTIELIEFIKKFEQKHGILLEQVYTGKLIYALYKLIEQDYFKPNSTIVAVHTGGLQGRNF